MKLNFYCVRACICPCMVGVTNRLAKQVYMSLNPVMLPLIEVAILKIIHTYFSVVKCR